MSAQESVDAALKRSPYARFLDLRATVNGDTALLTLPYDEKLIGNPAVPALHGGVIGAFMEIAAIAQIAVLRPDGPYPKTINVTIDFLRPARLVDTFAEVHVTRLGRRIAHARAEAWQKDRAQLIAALHGNFLIERES
jgi:uncharacterized protein (TIGR00369 family)